MHNFQINILIQFFSVFDVFSMLRTSWVHTQQDSRKRTFCAVCLHTLVQSVRTHFSTC